jgi:fructose-1,6-bisphosphatase II
METLPVGISTAWPESGADILFGIGGTPEGVITAAALKCMGGDMQGKLWPRNDQERDAAIAAGYDLDRVIGIDDLVQATIASSPPPASPMASCSRACASIPYTCIRSRSVMRSRSGTVRLINAMHRVDSMKV